MIKIEKVTKNYRGVKALDGVSLEVKQGEFISLVGASGSGKSTLLHLMGLLDRPSEGSVSFAGQRVDGLSDIELSKFRGKHIGFVFQAFHLIPELTVLENVLLPFTYCKSDLDPHAEAEKVLKRVGLFKRKEHLPSELSGGEAQRACIARALVLRPPVILADEPTGNLDSKTGAEIFEIFDQLTQEGLTFVMVTHDQNLADRAERKVTLKDGRIVDDSSN